MRTASAPERGGIAPAARATPGPRSARRAARVNGDRSATNSADPTIVRTIGKPIAPQRTIPAFAAQTFLLTDCFGCPEQIAQWTGRRALHLAEVLRDVPAGPGKRDPRPAR